MNFIVLYSQEKNVVRPRGFHAIIPRLVAIRMAALSGWGEPGGRGRKALRVEGREGGEGA